LLGETIAAAEGDDFLQLIEQIRGLSKQGREEGALSREPLLAILRELKNEQLVPVARAFSQFLNLSNIADQQHTVSRQMDPLLSASRNLADGMRGLLEEVYPARPWWHPLRNSILSWCSPPTPPRLPAAP
jgi:phosphoenolpyruvate carboxylase